MVKDPIVALATPPGIGGIGVVRISGFGIESICDGILKRLPKPRFATFTKFFDRHGIEIDEGIALYFPSPNSFTGEDVLELQAHGGPVVLDLLIERTLELGARIARPGEFSERAFLNDKIDLLQAEAIADLIEARTVHAARSARRVMQGDFSVLVNELIRELIDLRIYVEAAIDFSEQEIEFLSYGIIKSRLTILSQKLEQILIAARKGAILRAGMSIVIAGKPNSGKSSLLNLLAKKEAAIVTNQPGTTRDILRETIEIDGVAINFIDTAGLRFAQDPIEQEGIRRARLEIDQADRILWMVDTNETERDKPDEIIVANKTKVTQIFNKIDLTNEKPALMKSKFDFDIYMSVKTGEGVDILIEHFTDLIGFSEKTEDIFLARRRHVDSIETATTCIKVALTQINFLEIIAEELKQAQQSLSKITGAFTTDDLLGEIFSTFCIGK